MVLWDNTERRLRPSTPGGTKNSCGFIFPKVYENAAQGRPRPCGVPLTTRAGECLSHRSQGPEGGSKKSGGVARVNGGDNQPHWSVSADWWGFLFR